MEEYLKQIPLKDGLEHKIRIVILGPDNIRSENLITELAKHYNGRSILSVGEGTQDSFLSVAERFVNTENSLIGETDFLFTNQCLLSINLIAETDHQIFNPALQKAARKHKYDLFIISINGHDDGNAIANVKSELSKYEKPFLVIDGDTSLHRVKAITTIDELQKAKTMGFSSADFLQAHNHGISFDDIEDHLQFFQKGINKIKLDRPASAGDGIVKLSDQQTQQFAEVFTSRKDELVCQKFVPASGAASRMFKFLSEFLSGFNPDVESINSYINRKNALQLSVFLAGMEKFPFFESVDRALREIYSDFQLWPRDKKNFAFIETLLQGQQFQYADKPKGILPFHKYPTHIATPIHEHLIEAACYASSESAAKIHFTVTDEHQSLFEQIVNEVCPAIEEKFNVTVQVDYSYQDPSTDTLAVDAQNQPFRDSDGRLVFRPGGHGALLRNLNYLDADVIFIKNIDNVVHDDIERIALYKKALAGLLIDLQEQVFIFLQQINDDVVKESDVENIVAFMADKLNISIGADFRKYTLSHQLDFITTALNRPMRVCGMVKNEGEPGGGPFWVRDQNGLSLQIVESSQIDLRNPEQKEILEKSGYFNPVDIVCSTRNFRGEKFVLTKYSDPDTGFIVSKNKGGRDVKAYELPGLWNGAMAHWITVFVEVPLMTFNPVKTVNDLLKPAHQPS